MKKGVKMNIRTIKYEEVSKFAELGNSEAKKDSLREKILDMWEKGISHPELCFVLEDEERFLGRVLYFKYPSEPLELKMALMHLPSDRNVLEALEQLLKESLKELKNKGFNSVEYHLYSKDSNYFYEYKELFLKMGFQILQEKKNFLYKLGRLAKQGERLSFKSLQEVGEELFIQAIKDVTEGTLDEVDRKSVEALGAEKAALDYFNLIKEMDYNKEWWKLAYINNNELVGLVVPQKFSDKVGAINYIGVVPEKRGQGFIEELLIEGTNILIDDNIKEVIADIDSNNFPLEKALFKLNYELDSDIAAVKLNM